MAEKKLTEIPRPLREQYEKGLAAFERNNFDYAIAILSQALAREPAFFDCRQALRASQFKKAGSGGGFLKKIWGGASSSPLVAKGQMALRNNPKEAIEIAEQVISGDPNNSAAHKLLAEAALEMDLPRTAVLSLEILAKNSPKDKNLSRRLAEAYVHAGELDKAEAIYLDLARARPGDNEIAQALKDISARRTMIEGGYDSLAGGSGSYRDILQDKEEAVALEQESRQVKTEDVAARLIRDYEARLAEHPSDQKLMRNIADLYLQKNDFDRAIEYFQRIFDSGDASDPTIEKAITDATLKKFDQQLAALDADAPDHAGQSARVKSERAAFLLEGCRRRARKYPNDLQIRFELGQLYFSLGNVTEAIQEFQKSQAHPHRRVASLNCLGQCFARRGMNDLALRSFENALKEKVTMDEEKKDLLYNMGCVLETMGRAPEAIEQFKQIYEIDIGYRDVAAKVDAYYQTE